DLCHRLNGWSHHVPALQGADAHASVARHRTAPSIEYVLLAGLVAIFFSYGFVPAWKSLNTDFPNYYLAARLYRQGYPLEKLYDWTWMQRQKDYAGIQRPIVTFTLLTPFSLLPVLPFSSLPPLEAKHCWLVINLLLLAFTGFLLCRLTRLGARRVAILMFLAIVPLRTNFLFGQEYVLLLFLLTLAAYVYLRGRPVSCGSILAVAGALKIYPALFLLFFIRKRQWRSAITLCAGSCLLWIVSIGLFGFETIRTYIMEVLPWPLRGQGQDPYSLNWNSFSALLHRLFIAEPELNPHPLVHAPVPYAILQPMCQALIVVPFLWLLNPTRADVMREKMEWAGYTALLLILSTNPSSYDFNLLILTAVLSLDYLIVKTRRGEATALVLLYAFTCFPVYKWAPRFPQGWEIMLAMPRLWAMTGLWICILVIMARAESGTVRPRLRSMETGVFAIIFIVLIALGAGINLSHLKGQFTNYATRLASTPGSQFAGEPAIAGETVMFTKMVPQGYRTAILNQGTLSQLTFESDSFHPASAPGSSLAWVELASTRSRIVRVSVDKNGRVAGDFYVEADDAGKPAISFDGRWLAFVREKAGRGSLWIKELRSPQRDNTGVAGERQLSPTDLDVLDVAFYVTGRIVFSARRRNSQPDLFVTDPFANRVLPEDPGLPKRYPAASPDGRWLAFSQLEGSYWQLWVHNVSTHAEQRLTNSDCNSVAPAWYPDSKSLVYATDCGRGYGLTALCRIQVTP
ncbi:MAG: glycosyltransferase 87 family protein, partial [Terriglobia bacterium]